MDLLEFEEQTKKKKKTKGLMIFIIIIILLLIGVSVFLTFQISNIQKSTLKLVVDNQNKSFSNNMFVIENDKVYINIKRFAELIGYSTFNGDFKTKYSEDTTNCYISIPEEIASFSLNSATIYKQVQQSGSNNEPYDYEYYDIPEPVRYINGELYVISEGMEIGTNSIINYDQENNTISVATLDNIVSIYGSAFANAEVNDTNGKVKFNNKKALRYELVVIKSADGHYGVLNSDGNEIIGAKYKDIEYIEGSREFTVMTDEGTMGILSADGTTKIEPSYTEIKQISKELNYYLVANDKKYGVINQNGNTVIYLEFEQIGIDEEDFTANDIENPYILFDNCIPVKRNKLWGLYDINGKVIVPVEYEKMGCINGTGSNRTSNNVVIIPQYEAIVMGNTEDKYAIFSSLGRMYVQPVLDSVYSITTSGENKYYMTFTMSVSEDGKIVDKVETYDIDTYFAEHIVTTPNQPQINTGAEGNTSNPSDLDANSINTNTNTNTTTNTTTSGENASNTVNQNVANTVANTTTNTTVSGTTPAQ